MADALPIDEVDEPLRGYKLAEVRGDAEPRLHPSGRFWRRHYDHLERSTAVCHRHRHVAPDVGCTCGFHAVGDPTTLPEVTDHHDHMVLLEVELGGTVIEHERGMRAEQQTVLAVHFPERCARCARPAARVQPGRVWRSVCDTCAPPTALTRADAIARIGVDVSFTAPPPPSRPARALEILRGFSVVVLTAVCAVFAARISPSMVVAMLPFVAASLVFAAVTAMTRLPRTRESMFICQSVTLFLASMVLIAATP